MLTQYYGISESDVIKVLLREKSRKIEKEKRMSAQLQWNNQSGQYEAHVGNEIVQVDGDEFSEERAKLQKEYQDRGMNADAAYEKADQELSSPFAWRTDL